MNLSTIVKCATMFCTSIVVVASLATDFAFAQPRPPLAIAANNPRFGAIHDCSNEVQKWSDRDWETTKSARYGACMTNHGQVP
jgi:hypothetical protein